MEVSALLENAKQYGLPFVCMLNHSLIDLKQVVKSQCAKKVAFRECTTTYAMTP